MKKKSLIIVLVGVMLAAVWVTASWAQPEKIVLDNSEAFKHKKRSPVTFPHELHCDSLECLDCHHRYEKGENVLDEDSLEEGNADIRCASCHTWEARVQLRSAFHLMCTGCHTKNAKKGAKTGPRTCGGCHVITK
ncbi:MAG: cytochrome c3 family protein [Pseudomonadota bacterium]|nr:cytochrome c3 family protein [Pseudomonadota bacterium]